LSSSFEEHFCACSDCRCGAGSETIWLCRFRYNQPVVVTAQDLSVLTEADYERLPEDGRWEVVEGRAVLLPQNDLEHQYVCDALLLVFRTKLKTLGAGFAVSAPAVRLPPRPGVLGEIQIRVPDLAEVQIDLAEIWAALD
jgi:hypothetical protein